LTPGSGRTITVEGNPQMRHATVSQHHTGGGIARAYAAFPCANQASWLVTSITGMTTDPKPQPRRPLTS